MLFLLWRIAAELELVSETYFNATRTGRIAEHRTTVRSPM
jgi:hypothetical protein